MKQGQLSPVIIRFKALPDVPVVAVSDGRSDACKRCELNDMDDPRVTACLDDDGTPSGNCLVGNRRYERV